MLFAAVEASVNGSGGERVESVTKRLERTAMEASRHSEQEHHMGEAAAPLEGVKHRALRSILHPQ